jgi:hypothetical protein
MKPMAAAIAEAICLEHGPDELLDRLADPFWFGAFGCVLGFDWHSSGLTTVACGALKEALADRGKDLGIYVAGGKGRTSRKTPAEIETFAGISSATIDAPALVYASRMTAKVDSAAVQDGYQVYHHTFVFTDTGSWAVIQQGMNDETGMARRYHWLGSTVEDFVNEPHAAVAADERHPLLNMVASESGASRDASAEIARMRPGDVLAEVEHLPLLDMPRRHELLATEDINPKHLRKVLLSTYEAQVEDFERLLSMPGVGAKTVRSLALIGELIYGARPSLRDPARFSFAHGGKDGTPFPVDRDMYSRTIHILTQGVNRAKLGHSDKLRALDALRKFLDRRSV